MTHSASQPTLSVRGLTRRYGEKTVVQPLDFTLRPGVMTGFLGANGAGKTTTMRMIMGMLAPSGGEVLWNGAPITSAQLSTFGYMPEERGLYPKQKVQEQLTYLGRLHGMSTAEARSRAQEMLAAFGLEERSKDLLEALSLGNQQRVQIIAALLHDPKCLVLDEPFSGLDPVAVDSMAQMLEGFLRRGVPVLFSSHQLDLVERLCEDVLILHEGRLVASGAAQDLRDAAPPRYRLICGEDTGWVREIPGIEVLDVDGREAVIELPRGEHGDALRTQALDRAMRADLHEFRRIQPTMSEIYRKAIR